MATFFEELGRAVKQNACAIITLNDEINGFAVGLGVPGSENYQNITRALRRQLCNNSDDTVPVPEAPFQGGQCTGVEYRYKFLYNDSNPNAGCPPGSPKCGNANLGCGGNAALRVWAPIGPLTERPVSGGQTSYEFTAKDSQGNDKLVQLLITASDITNIEFGPIGRCDSQPDDCGDPGSDPIPPYSPTSTTINIEYEDNSQTTINEDVDITIFAPQVNIGGAIFAPITIAGNTFNLVGTVELTPEFKLNVSPEINVNLGNGNTDNPVPDPDGDFPEPTTDPNERRVIIGAIATATFVSDRTDFLPQGDNPDVGLPDLGLLNFYISTPNGTAWTGDIKVKNVRSYIPCPVASGAVDVAGTARNGVQLDIQPVWGYPGQNVPT